MAGRTVRYYDLTGGLNTSQGFGTVNSGTRGTDCIDTFNVEYYKLSGLKSMEGNKQFGNTLPAQISLGHEYRQGANKYCIVTTTDGKVYEYNKVTNEFDIIYTFHSATKRCSACNFNQGVILSNGVDDLVYYNKGRNTLINGTMSGEANGIAITGTDTKFTVELGVGDYISVDGNTYKITKITGNTNMEVTPNIVATFNDVTGRLTPISELNATYINSDDETVNYPIRGLSINTYKGRIFIGGDDGNLYYSELGLIHGWDVKYGAGAIPAFYNDNSDFTGLGLYGDYLVIHKRDCTYLLAGNDDPSNWAITPYADLSCDSQQSWVSANNAYYVYSRKAGGIYPLLARTIYINNYLGDEISKKIRETFRNVNTALYNQIFPVYHPTKKYIMFYMPMLQGKGSNYCYIYDLMTKSWLVRIVPQTVTIAFRYNDRIYIGTKDGLVLEEFKGLNFNGEPIEFSWKSPWFFYGDGTDYLSTREFRCKISEEMTNNFYVRNRRDGYDEYKERNVTNNKPSFQALEWSDDVGEITDTVWDEYEWIESGYLVKRFPLPNQFFTSQQIEFHGKSLDSGMCLLGFELDRIELEETPW